MSESAPPVHITSEIDARRRLSEFIERLRHTAPDCHVSDSLIDRVAMASDASVYRLVPKLIVRPKTISEMSAVMSTAHETGAPIVFRAGGTSLSGQAVTDNVLVSLGASWRAIDVLDDGAAVRVEPGLTGGEVNARLKAYGRKIGPDPASINAAKIGGIAANNASGMCCGIAQNSYQTLRSMKIILPDGAVLDTADAQSRAQFKNSHSHILSGLNEVASQARTDTELSELIKRKFRIKNTMGYSLNALIDFEDPVDILQHLMIGSEGTLGYIAEIVYATVPDFAYRATALIYYQNIQDACAATSALEGAAVAAAELMDNVALRSVREKLGESANIAYSTNSVCALLVEVRANAAGALAAGVAGAVNTLQHHSPLRPVKFTQNASEQARLWAIRKGLFPAAGAVRPANSSVIIEDVCFPLERLEESVTRLRALLDESGYASATIFGHALAGNVHFVFSQRFGKPEDHQQYKDLMQALSHLVAGSFDGSLKAEHGAGRNMAPFVEFEWGVKAYALMKRIKALFDPKGVLAPDVIISDDPQIHLKHLKDLPSTDALVDKCIECGFCEPSCPSSALTLSPRQRIAVLREISRAEGGAGAITKAEIPALQAAYHYSGDETCAACGMCSLACPVDINTGDLTRKRRALSAPAPFIANFIVRHFSAATNAARQALRLGRFLSNLIGARQLVRLSSAVHRLTQRTTPVWRASTPLPAPAIRKWRRAFAPVSGEAPPTRFVYFSACGNRIFGRAPDENSQPALQEVLGILAQRAGIELELAPHMTRQCCGMAFHSKGYPEASQAKTDVLIKTITPDDAGAPAILITDMSACAQHLQDVAKAAVEVWDPVLFASRILVPRLQLVQLPLTIALHLPCSVSKLGRTGMLKEMVSLCAENVVSLDDIACCGFAGDKGFLTPELNQTAIKPLQHRADLKHVDFGVSTNRTCEIGLADATDFHWRSLFDLLEQASRRPNTKKTVK